MKKYRIKKYYEQIDIVLVISITCLIWIVLYKFSFLNLESIFYYADILGEIFYTLCTSVVAAGMFYLVTVYIPKRSQIKRMDEYISSNLKQIYVVYNNYIPHINKSGTSINYTVDSFFETLRTDVDGVKKDFITYHLDSKNAQNFKAAITYQFNFVNAILLSYSNLLPNEITLCLNDYCIVRFKNIRTDYLEENNYTSDQNFWVLYHLYRLCIMLDDYLMRRNETV